MRIFDRLSPTVLSVFRIVVAVLFVCHGASSLFGVFGGARGTGNSIPMGTWPGWWAALIQFAGGLLVAVGLATRPAALLCSGSMAYAYFMVHQEQAFLPLQNGGEAAAMFCWAFFLIAILGPGPISLDALIARRLGRGRVERPATVRAGAVRDTASV